MFRVYVHDGSEQKDTTLAVATSDIEAEVDAWVCPTTHVDSGVFTACQSARRCVFNSYDAAVEALVLENVNLVCASKAERERVTENKRIFKKTLASAKIRDNPKEKRLVKFAKKYKLKLGKGRIVFAPPGSGKSTFVAKHSDWVDEDVVAGELHLHTEHWEQRHSKRAAHYKTIDVWLKAMKDVGFKVLGSLFWDYVPDLIVIIPENVHKQYVANRDDLEWDDVKKKRDFLIDLARRQNVRVVSSFDAI